LNFRARIVLQKARAATTFVSALASRFMRLSFAYSENMFDQVRGGADFGLSGLRSKRSARRQEMGGMRMTLFYRLFLFIGIDNNR
jgi:hypothetical protein